MKATDYIARYLSEKKVSAVFEMSGGMITHLLDSIHQLGKTKIVSTHHEQAAAFAAEGYGRMTGIPGVAMATSGPGATNLLTGIGSCYFDSTPAVFITGQVNRHEQKGDRKIRQLGFQETDIVAMARPITKDALMIRESADVPERLDYAFRAAVSGRPGPVLIDIPMDVQRGDINPDFEAKPDRIESFEGDGKFIDQMMTGLEKAKSPLVLAGGGIRSGRCAEVFDEFITKLGVPVVHSLMAVDVLPFSHPLRMGMIGTYGNRWANIALYKSDFVIVLGSRLDVRQTGADTNAFSDRKTIFHVDCEPGEMNNRVKGCTTLVADLASFFRLAASQSIVPIACDDWIAEIHASRDEWPDIGEQPDIKGINPNVLMHALSHAGDDVSAYVADVGQHQMWAAQSLKLKSGQRFLTSGGMGAMGFALPTALGVAMGSPNQPCVVVAGDGGFQTNIQDLETIRRNCMPIKLVVVNNKCHGMVRQFQESYFEARYQSTMWGYSAPDFEKVGTAYGIDSQTVTDPDKLDAAVTKMMSDPNQPALLQVMVDTYANAYPKVAFGRPIKDMEPYATPIEMEST
ncbi:thiamine pyrophosphate-binding protein [Novipirellula sp.]|uniref:thiamine pyrophosphate-binding protein n=1 Tax=Novipirellula sp. TaxID=2795430 RepID=UPI003566FA65